VYVQPFMIYLDYSSVAHCKLQHLDIVATMAPSSIVAVLLFCAIGNVGAVQAETSLSVNPIRKVVTLLQNMQKKIAEEGAKAEKAFDGYMCYCNNADGTLGKSISDAETRIPQLESSIKEGAATKKQMEADLKAAQVDRVEAKDAIAEATGILDDSHGSLGCLVNYF
jgi:hypothetical protein